MISALIAIVKNGTSRTDGLLTGLAAYGSAEIANRIVRIGAIIVIARRIGPEMMGAAALALSLFEIVRVLANSGIGQRIIAADEHELSAICNGGYRLFRLWCIVVGAIQLVIAGMLAAFHRSDVAWMLVVLCGVYATMPAGFVQVFLLMRDRRLGTTARISSLQTIADHLLTVVGALIWPSAWALVLPKLLTTPIWLYLIRRAHPWRHDASAPGAPASTFVALAVGVMGGDLVVAARSQCDNLIVGFILGTKALGLYYFAFSAGLGITTSFVAAFSTVLYPILCKGRDAAEKNARYRHALMVALLIFLPVLAAQVGLAPFYVPLVFGAKWAVAAPLVATLGLAAIALVLGAGTTALMRATGRAGRDASINLLAGAAALAGLAIGTRFGLRGATCGYVAGLSLVLFPYAAVIYRRTRSPVLCILSHQERFA